MKLFNLIYDNIIDNIRTVKIKIDDFDVNFTYNYKLNNLYVAINNDNFIAPNITYENNDFTLVFNYLFIPPNQRKEFENTYKKCVEFCENSKELVDDIINRIKNNQEVKEYE